MPEQQPPKFKIGDLVRLKSGGPAMTVRTPRRVRAEGMAFSEVVVTCNYFDQREMKTADVPEDALEATKPDDQNERERRADLVEAAGPVASLTGGGRGAGW